MRILALACMITIPALSAMGQQTQPGGAPVTVDRSQRPTVGVYLHDGWQIKAFSSSPKAELPSTIVLQKNDQAILCTLAPPDDASLPGRLGTVKTAGCYQMQ